MGRLPLALAMALVLGPWASACSSAPSFQSQACRDISSSTLSQAIEALVSSGEVTYPTPGPTKVSGCRFEVPTLGLAITVIEITPGRSWHDAAETEGTQVTPDIVMWPEWPPKRPSPSEARVDLLRDGVGAQVSISASGPGGRRLPVPELESLARAIQAKLS